MKKITVRQLRSLIREAFDINSNLVDLPDMKRLIELIEEAELLRNDFESKRRILQQDIDLSIKNLKTVHGLRVTQIKSALEGIIEYFDEYFINPW